MNEIKVSLDNVRYQAKPEYDEVGAISNRIAKGGTVLNCPVSVDEFVWDVGHNGQTFSPAVFKDGVKSKQNIEEIQMFALDFDNKNDDKITWKEAQARSRQYNLPVLFSYYTLSSKQQDRFRMVFLNDTPLSSVKAAEIHQNILLTIFPEADPTCKDISKMYYGGKELIYYNQTHQKLELEAMTLDMYRYLKDKHGDNNYKRNVQKFAKENGIALDGNGMLGISLAESSAEQVSTDSFDTTNEKNSPSTIIYTRFGEKFSNRMKYKIDLTDREGVCPSTSSADKKLLPNHNPYRSQILKDIPSVCQLCREFEEGLKKLPYDQLRGVGTNIINVDGGHKWFLDILSKPTHERIYGTSEGYNRWDYYLKGFKKKQYKPSGCAVFCPYKDTCSHGTNILSTVKPKPRKIEKLSTHSEVYHSVSEAEEDFRLNLTRAILSNDTKKHVIKAQVALGKTNDYLNYAAAYPDEQFLIAVPTNILKHEVCQRAKKMGIQALVTPSLEEIKDDMPSDVWGHIQKLYDAGRHRAVHPYIRKVVDEQSIPCLVKYLKELKEFESFGGCVITTHKKLFGLNEEVLGKYAAVIIDEDIIFKSIITNQSEITVSDMKKVLKKTTNKQLSGKIKKMLKQIKTKAFFKLPRVEWDDNNEDEDGISIGVDIPSFSIAEHFCYRKASKVERLEKNTISFLNPVTFKDIKYIIVSATVDEQVYRYYFGEKNVTFYDCKQAEIMGTLNQYPDKSYSRTSIDNNPGILEHIKGHFGIKNLITHKKYGAGPLWFGNCDGCDFLAGQDLLVIGTPYHAGFLYKLFAFTIGLDFDENAEMKRISVTHKGYRFYFTTYDDEALRNVHMWMIESELEQAVGRARLLRKDCTVHLFSNYPLSHANFAEFEHDKDVKDEA